MWKKRDQNHLKINGTQKLENPIEEQYNYRWNVVRRAPSLMNGIK